MRDLTKGSPAKLILIFTIPLLVGNVFQQFYNMVDMIIVGQTLGKEALAAVGSTGSITFLIIGFAQGLSAGLSIITAQRYGAKDYRGVKRSFAVSVLISLLVTLILTGLSLLLIDPLLQVMQTPADIYNQAKEFITIILGGMVASMAFNLLSNMIRALGDSRTPLFFLIFAVIINVVLDLVFIQNFGMGVAGAAWATLIAQLASSLMCYIYILHRIPLLQLKKEDFHLTKNEYATHLNAGLPMAFQSSIIAIGTVILQTALNSLGTDVVAAQAAAGRIDQFATQPMMSFGVTMATFTGQNFGAKQYQRILTGVRQCLTMSIGFSIVAGIAVIIFGHNFVSLFVSAKETKVFELAQTYFNITASLYWILAILFILRYTLQGLGQAKVPTIAGVMELFMRAFAAIFLTQLMGYPGAVLASPLAWIGSVAVLLYSYLKAMKTLKHLAQEQNNLPQSPETTP